MKSNVFCCLILSILFFFFNCQQQYTSKKSPLTEKGILDLRASTSTDKQTGEVGWDFKKDGRINLDGQWEFY